MNAGTLTTSQIEDLVAWLDGELDGERSGRIAEQVRVDPTWREAFEQFHALDRTLDDVPAAAPPPGLTDRIVRAANRKTFWHRALQVAGPLAAAACIVAAVYLGVKPAAKPPVSGVEAAIAKVLAPIPPEERFVVQNLPFFQNYDEVVSYQTVSDAVDAETLSALKTLDAGEGL